MTVMGKVIGLMEQDIGASRRAVFLAGVHDGVPIALGYFVVAFTLGILAKTAGLTLVANARYFLMSAALTQRFAPDTSLLHRLAVSFGVSDEIFGITVARGGMVNPYYNYGAMAIAVPAWAIGTSAGILAGGILPAAALSALSVALYGMFVWVILPPAKKSRPIAGMVGVSFALSLAATYAPITCELSGGTRTIILTLLIAGVGAWLFPITEQKEDADA